MTAKLILSSCLFSLLLGDCSPKDQKGVYYTLSMEAESEMGAAAVAKSTFMSYKGYLFEIFYRSVFNAEMNPNSVKHKEKTVPDGIAVIDTRARRYVSFDSVYGGASIADQGALNEKKLGMRWLDASQAVEIPGSESKLWRDTMVLDQQMKTARFSHESNGQRANILLIVLPEHSFTSPLDLNAKYDKNPGGPVLTMYSKLEDKPEGGGYKLREFREMTPDERELCNKLIVASGLKGK